MRRECPVFEGVKRGLVQRDRIAAMNEMVHAASALHEALEHDFVVAVRARPETEIFLFGAMLQ